MKRTLFRIYAYQFLADFTPIALLYSVMFTEQRLSTFEISFLIGAWSLASLLCEVPSGVVADMIDRRIVLTVGQLITACAFMTWIIEPGFWGYLIGFLLWGIAGATYSGTFEAFVYDELAANGNSEKYVQVLGRTEAASLIGVVAGSAFAAVVVQFGYTTLIWASIASALLAASIVMTFPRAAARESVDDGRYLSVLKRGFRYALTTPALARFIAIIAVGGCITDLATEYAPLFASDRAVGASGIAAIGTVSILVMAAASAFATRMPGASLPAPMQLLAAGVLIIAATLLPTWPAVIAFNLSAVVANVTHVIARANMQTHIEDEIRATTTSVAGFTQEVLNVAGLLAVGLLADQMTRTDAFFWLGLAIVIATTAGLLIDRKYRTND